MIVGNKISYMELCMKKIPARMLPSCQSKFEKPTIIVGNKLHGAMYMYEVRTSPFVSVDMRDVILYPKLNEIQTMQFKVEKCPSWDMHAHMHYTLIIHVHVHNIGINPSQISVMQYITHRSFYSMNNHNIIISNSSQIVPSCGQWSEIWQAHNYWESISPWCMYTVIIEISQ